MADKIKIYRLASSISSERKSFLTLDRLVHGGELLISLGIIIATTFVIQLGLHWVLRQIVRLNRIFWLLVGFVMEHWCGFSLLASFRRRLLGLVIESLLCVLATWSSDVLLMHCLMVVLLSVVPVGGAAVAITRVVLLHFGCGHRHLLLLIWMRLGLEQVVVVVVTLLLLRGGAVHLLLTAAGAAAATRACELIKLLRGFTELCWGKRSRLTMSVYRRPDEATPPKKRILF